MSQETAKAAHTVQFFGSNDYRTQPSCYYGDVEYHSKELDYVANLISSFAKTYPKCVKLICKVIKGNERLIAYRFTSDKAYDELNPIIMNAGGAALGRGVWHPFDYNYQFDRWLKNARNV